MTDEQAFEKAAKLRAAEFANENYGDPWGGTDFEEGAKWAREQSKKEIEVLKRELEESKHWHQEAKRWNLKLDPENTRLKERLKLTDEERDALKEIKRVSTSLDERERRVSDWEVAFMLKLIERMKGPDSE